MSGWRDYYGGHFYEKDLTPMEDVEDDDWVIVSAAQMKKHPSD